MMDMLREAKRQIPSEELRSRLGVGSIENALRCGRLRLYGHVQRMGLGRWTRQSLLVITLGAAQGRHGYNV